MNYKPIVIKALVYHELAHCEFKLDHSGERTGDLMDVYLYSKQPEYYEKHWSQLVRDLKNKAGR